MNDLKNNKDKFSEVDNNEFEKLITQLVEVLLQTPLMVDVPIVSHTFASWLITLSKVNVDRKTGNVKQNVLSGLIDGLGMFSGLYVLTIMNRSCTILSYASKVSIFDVVESQYWNVGLKTNDRMNICDSVIVPYYLIKDKMYTSEEMVLNMMIFDYIMKNDVVKLDISKNLYAYCKANYFIHMYVGKFDDNANIDPKELTHIDLFGLYCNVVKEGND